MIRTSIGTTRGSRWGDQRLDDRPSHLAGGSAKDGVNGAGRRRIGDGGQCRDGRLRHPRIGFPQERLQQRDTLRSTDPADEPHPLSLDVPAGVFEERRQARDCGGAESHDRIAGEARGFGVFLNRHHGLECLDGSGADVLDNRANRRTRWRVNVAQESRRIQHRQRLGQPIERPPAGVAAERRWRPAACGQRGRHLSGIVVRAGHQQILGECLHVVRNAGGARRVSLERQQIDEQRD
jgi:hypothetical protein